MGNFELKEYKAWLEREMAIQGSEEYRSRLETMREAASQDIER